ncbi:TraB/VirB10 family protein [Novosphingobium sp.]|uniref:TraB/VirB10 family protein n=1 Tax=Novosphingobium sp. TaxID=1874826 RepID=UPI00261C83C0|nr:TraB/VirB10 family protein [Novosphingobium sp.]
MQDPENPVRGSAHAVHEVDEANATPASRREVGRRNLNRQIAQRQKVLLAGVGAIALLGGAAFLFAGGDDKSGGAAGTGVSIDTGSLVNRNLSEREFVATYGNRADAQDREIKALKEGQVSRPELEEQLAALKTENAQMRTDGQSAIDAISAENASLKAQLDQASRALTAPAMPPPAYGPGVAPGSVDGASRQSAGGPAPEAKVSLMSFETSGAAPAKSGSDPSIPQLLLQDSPDYLPPNSYASARVIVGVDASTGVASQTDPLPVVLRITGPARSVLRGGKVLTTDITGCLVNGAARGDLSSEKVYVKLARMTCAQPGGRYAVSEVKGFISFAGKSGVRGRVVSRAGSLVGKALLAGIVGGFGRGFSANANGIFTGQIGADGKRQALSPTDIVTGGIGQGAGEAADTVSKYLIERAEQYQPVVEMPTGIEVEIVFLDGVHVRSNTK